MTVADNVLADTRKQVNITLWMIAVRNALRDETNPVKRRYLAEMLVELNNRLPERKAA